MPPTPAQQANMAAIIGNYLTQVSPFIGWLPKAYWRRKKEFFAYTVNFTPLAAAAAGVVQGITMDSDSDFALMLPELEMTSTDETAEFSYAPALVNVASTINNASIFQNPAHVMTFAPPGKQLYLPMPFIAPAGTVLNTSLSNLDLVNSRNYRFTYYGFKIFNVETN